MASGLRVPHQQAAHMAAPTEGRTSKYPCQGRAVHTWRNADFAPTFRHRSNDLALQIGWVAGGFGPFRHCAGIDHVMVSPMLYEIGEEWKRGALSVEAEHRFTAFAEELIELVEAKITGPSSSSNLPFASTPIFLMNAPGNRHKLALRILALWLRRRGAQVNVLPDNLDPETLKRELVLWRPRFLLISMALTEQGDQIAEITEAAQSLPSDIRPRTFVGGYPVKTGLVGSIPNAEVRADISMLEVAARMAS